MRNKEIKKGDKIWLYDEYIIIGYTVKSVRKDSTLVSVIVESKYINDKVYEIKMYGHASSSLLSGYDRKWPYCERCYTCDYSLIESKKEKYERDLKYREAGIAFLNLVKYIK